MSRQKLQESGLNLISRQIQNVQNYKGKLIMKLHRENNTAIMMKYRTGGALGTRVTKDKHTAHLNGLFKFTQELYG